MTEALHSDQGAFVSPGIHFVSGKMQADGRHANLFYFSPFSSPSSFSISFTDFFFHPHVFFLLLFLKSAYPHSPQPLQRGRFQTKL